MYYTMVKATTVFLVLVFGVLIDGMTAVDKSVLKLKKDNIQNKKARDVISSFLNAWKTSKIIPEYGRDEKSRNVPQKFSENENFQLGKLDFLGHRKSELDGPALFALQNALNPKPVRKPRLKQSNYEAETFFGKDEVDEDDRSPELKLASLISKPIYHTLPGGSRPNAEDEIKQFMFGQNGDTNENNVGLPSDDWQANLNGRRSFVHVPGTKRDGLYVDTEVPEIEDNGHKRYDIPYRNSLIQSIRNLRNEVPVDNDDHQEINNLIQQIGDKKELITDPYDTLALPVSEFLGAQENDRKFYRKLPYNLIDEYETRDVPAEFKLQKNHLWGNIQKRWRRSKVNKLRLPVEEEQNVMGVGRSLGDSVGETGHMFDAYGEIGQNMDQSLLRLNGERASGCGQTPDLTMPPVAAPNHGSAPSLFLDNAGMQQEDPKQTDSGIIQISPDGTHVRDSIHRSRETLAHRIMRNKRSLLMLQKRSLADALAKKVKEKSTVHGRKIASTAAGRSLAGHYAGGLPDSRGTEEDDGITEDNEHDNLDDKLSHDSTPLLMKIAQHDREDMNKFWSNKHSPGNGFYTGHGEGPNHAYLGDYFGHGPDEMLHDDGIKSLEESASPEDHHTANLIDSIWEHDLGEDHLGGHHVERHHGLKIKSYFGGHRSPGIMLPTETLDGIDTHWTGHLPHVHSSEYSHNEGHPIDFSPTRIKAIQAIQDDPAIDAELNPHDGIGMVMGHGHHASHGYHHEEGHAFGGMNLSPVVGDPVHVEDSHEEEYKQHIDNLLSQYHGLEERLRGTGGTLAAHMDPGAFTHHGSHHLHTGYDLYAYKNPWENMKIPYHVPVINHPVMESEEPPPSPLTFEGKTDEKGAPMVEGGKEEGGKGGPLVEGSKAVPEKNSEKESPKGAKSSGKKAPAPVIPKQRGGPDISTGKNETSTSDKEKEAKNTEEGSKVDENLKEENNSKEEVKENSSLTDNKADENNKGNGDEQVEAQANEKPKEDGNETESKEEKVKEKAGKEKGGHDKGEHDKGDEGFKKLIEKMMSSTGKQSELLNNLKKALGEDAKNPKSVTALQLAKLKQLGSMQEALLSSLVKQGAKKIKQNSQHDSDANGVSDLKQLIELQSLQQLGAGIKANVLANAVRQNSLLQSLKSAQENILSKMKTHSELLENGVLDKQEEKGTQASDIQKFFGKIPINFMGSDLGNVGSEKITGRSHQGIGVGNAVGENNIGGLVHSLSLVHKKKPQTALRASNIKPMLSNLLSESLMKTMKNKLRHISRNNVKENKEGTSTDSVYSTIGSEGPTTVSEEAPHRRSSHTRGKKKEKLANKSKEGKEEKDLNETATEKAEIAPVQGKDFDIDVVSKKDKIKTH